MIKPGNLIMSLLFTYKGPFGPSKKTLHNGYFSSDSVFSILVFNGCVAAPVQVLHSSETDFH